MRSRSLVRLSGVGVTLALATSCFWTAPSDDASDEHFVRTLVPALIGRKVHGSEELRVLVDILQADGEEAVADLLMRLPEFDRYWIQVLADDLRVERRGGGTMNHLCFADPALPDFVGGALLSHVGYGDPTQPFCYDPQDPNTWERQLAPDGIGVDQQDLATASAQSRSDAEHTDGAPSADAPAADAGALGDAGAFGDAGALGDAGADDPDAREAAHTGDGEATLDTGLYPVLSTLPGPDADNGPRGGTAQVAVGVDAAVLGVPPEPVEADARTAAQICPDFNMTDVLRASVRQDDLYPMYRAWAAPLSTYAFGTGETNQRNQAAEKFLSVYLDRHPSCLGCHTTNFSKTDARPSNDHWDRFEPLLLDLEGTAFSYRVTANRRFYGGNGGADIYNHVRNYFRTDVHTASGGFRPFGLVDECVTRGSRDGFVASVPPGGTGDRAALAGELWADDRSVLDLMDLLAQGRLDLSTAASVDPGWDLAADASQWSYYNCGGCHPSWGPDLATVIPTISNTKLLEILREGSGEMPAVYPDPIDSIKAMQYVRYLHPYTGPDLLETEAAALVTLLGT